MVHHVSDLLTLGVKSLGEVYTKGNSETVPLWDSTLTFPF